MAFLTQFARHRGLQMFFFFTVSLSFKNKEGIKKKKGKLY